MEQQRLEGLKERFLDRWNNGGGFMTHLCTAISKADCENLRALYKAYPDLVEGYIYFGMGKSWKEWSAR